ncbi:endonuclease VIII-like 3 [Senna tora]|uniref:Endonuclease VIII-like 3 n=1 Tax=Senna tora TaxID=362788 RepID=A0A834SR82_9FABA|nr:endonuclease VIII-like 3 [Senna tora]
MCEPELHPLPPPLPPPLKSISTPNFQLHSPETSSRYSPRLVQRMQNDTCFRCHQQGHWARDCPLNSPNLKSRASTTENSDFPKIYCRCGHGPCEVKTVKNERNCGRKYYVCPIKRGKRCRDFVKWCDDPADEIALRPPAYKFPTCSCGAGVCRKEKERNGPNEGRYYFACPIGEDHGACDFRLWEDTLLGNPVIDPAQQSGQRTLHDFWEGNQVHKTNINDLGKDGDSPSGLSKRMRITGDSQCSLVKTIFEVPKGEDAVLKEARMEGVDHDQTTELSTPTNHVNFPEFETVDDVEDNSVPWDALEEKARSSSRLSTSSKIQSRQREFQRQISTAAIASLVADPYPENWLGRLVFFHPNLTDTSIVLVSIGAFIESQPTEKGYLRRVLTGGGADRDRVKRHRVKCRSVQPSGRRLSKGVVMIQVPHWGGVSPSFDNIIVPKEESKHDGLCEPNQLLITKPEISENEASLNLSPGSQRKAMSKAQRQRQVVLYMQKDLLRELESLNPLDYESMRVAAEATFDLLSTLSVDYKQFSEHVWAFINSTASLAEIENSIKGDLSPEEYIRCYEEGKVRLANICDDYGKTKALLEGSHQRSQSLHKEASRLKAMLHEVEDQLTSCEQETLKMETRLGEINASMVEAEKSLEKAAEQASTARKLSEEKKAKQVAAKTALEKAKLELKN